MSQAASEINARSLRGSNFVNDNRYQGGIGYPSVRWIPEMNKGQGPQKPSQVQFTREVQSEREQQGTPVPGRNHQHNSQGRKVYQRLKGAISPDNIINGTYNIGKKLGEGSFGVIHQGTNILSKELVAIKFEPRKADAPQLADENRFYKMINPTIGFPKCYYFGREGPYSVLCIELLGPSLEDLFDFCGRKFSIKTVCMAAKQMLTRIWTIHENKYIYRDIKPDNFLIGRVTRTTENHLDVYNSAPSSPNIDRKIVDYYKSLQGKILDSHSPENPHPASLIYIVDFGMAKQYFDPYTQTHIPYREKKSLSGTARYMSINTHLGVEQSRRDDLEALGHVLMYFLRGSLPWQGLRGATNKQKYEKIGGKKQSTLIRSLCAGYPKEFETYLAYARSLKFSETPNYKYLINLFDNVLDKIGEKDDGVFDWMVEMDHQAEKNRLRENAWKRRDEREHKNAYKSWQNQYYSNLLTKQGRQVQVQPLPHQIHLTPILSGSSQGNLTASMNRTPQKNLALNTQVDQNVRYLTYHDQAHLLQKKRSLALESYRVGPGLTSLLNVNNSLPKTDRIIPPLPNGARRQSPLINTVRSDDSIISANEINVSTDNREPTLPPMRQNPQLQYHITYTQQKEANSGSLSNSFGNVDAVDNKGMLVTSSDNKKLSLVNSNVENSDKRIGSFSDNPRTSSVTPSAALREKYHGDASNDEVRKHQHSSTEANISGSEIPQYRMDAATPQELTVNHPYSTTTGEPCNPTNTNKTSTVKTGAMNTTVFPESVPDPSPSTAASKPFDFLNANYAKADVGEKIIDTPGLRSANSISAVSRSRFPRFNKSSFLGSSGKGDLNESPPPNSRKSYPTSLMITPNLNTASNHPSDLNNSFPSRDSPTNDAKNTQKLHKSAKKLREVLKFKWKKFFKK